MWCLQYSTNPGLRELPSLSKKGKNEVIDFVFITDDLVLYEMKTNSNNYWTIIDATGRIQEVPSNLLSVLEMQPWTSMTTETSSHSTTHLLLQSDTMIATIEFNMNAEVIKAIKYHKSLSIEYMYR